MALFEGSIADNPAMTLDDAIDWAFADFENDWKDFWGLDREDGSEYLSKDERREVRSLFHLAVKFAQGGSDLIDPRRFPPSKRATPELLEDEARAQQALVDEILKKVKKAASSDTYWQVYWALSPNVRDPRAKKAFFDTCLQLEAHKRFGTEPGRLAERMLRLIDATVHDAGELTRAYLARVASCYVREMKPEFAVMARASLDAAIQERIDDEGVKAAVGLRPDGRVDLERRIQACAAVGWLDSEGLAAATRLRETGRDAAHFTPGLEAELDDLLGDLVAVLRALEGDE